MSSFWTRTITGAVFVVLLMSSILFSAYSYAGWWLLLVVLGMWEATRLFSLDGNLLWRGSLVIFGVAFALCLWLGADQVPMWIAALIFPLITGMALWLFPVGSLLQIARACLSIAYVGLPVGLLLRLGLPPGGSFSPWPLMGFIWLIWTNDTGAYLIGSKWGKTKLFPIVSPNKTWEGTLGGIALAVVVAVVLGKIMPALHWTPGFAATLGILAGAGGTIGDLVESQLKRELGVKDSGTLLPGHGGILDRFDSLWYTAPFLYLLHQLA
jgi:phosphatidate cytidylyltransferase